MPRKNYDLCPRCNKKKVTVLADGEHEDVKKKLHNLHVIHAPYNEYRIWLCTACGWFAATHWHGESYHPKVYKSIYALVDKPKPDIELDFSAETSSVVYEFEKSDD